MMQKRGKLRINFVIESEVFGREKDKSEIVDMLIGCGNGEDLSVIPIIGMGD